MTRFRPPLGPGVRVDTHVVEGYAIPPFYDSLVAKVIVWAEDRPAAVRRARRALTEFELEGVPTTRELAIDILESEPFTSGRLHDRLPRRGGALASGRSRRRSA